MENIGSDLVTVLWIAAALCGIALLMAGAARRVVIYYDGADMSVTGLAVVLPLAAWGLFDSSLFESDLFNGIAHWIASPVLALAGLYCLLENFVAAIRHNRSIFLGLFIGVFKIVFLALTVLVIAGQLQKMFDEHSSFGDILVSLLLVAACVAVAGGMINGRKVYAVKGWEVPE